MPIDHAEIERKVIAELSGIYKNRSRKEIIPSDRIIDDLNADSINYLEASLLIENNWPEIGEVTDDEAYSLITVADIIALVKTRLRRKNLRAVH